MGYRDGWRRDTDVLDREEVDDEHPPEKVEDGVRDVVHDFDDSRQHEGRTLDEESGSDKVPLRYGRSRPSSTRTDAAGARSDPSATPSQGC